MLWSFSEVISLAGGGTGSLGTGVELRLPAQGLIESTAEAQVDFSAFLSTGPDAIVTFMLTFHIGEVPREHQLLNNMLGENKIGGLLRDKKSCQEQREYSNIFRT